MARKKKIVDVEAEEGEMVESVLMGGPEYAAEIVCKYSDRDRLIERMFNENAEPEGLLLKCPKCGTSILFQRSDRIPKSRMYCPSGKHLLINWTNLE